MGLWNVTNDFIAIEALKPYGYTIEKPSVFWIVLGISQIIWGLREFSIFGRIESWNIPNLTGRDLVHLKEKLQSFVQMTDDMEQRIVKGSITTNGPLGLGFLSNTTAYTGVLLNDRAIIVSDGLDDCFSIDKTSMNSTAFETDSAVQFLAEDGERNMVLSPLSVITFKTWIGKSLKPDDIQCAASNNTLNFSMIKPWLTSENPELRAASVTALAYITDDNAAKVAASITDDPNLDVQVAAIDACAKLKSKELMDKTIQYLASPDERFRSATAKYLCAVKQPSVIPTLKDALSKETNRTVKRELKRALQATQNTL